MNFSEALNAMKMGSKVSRHAWLGKISYWWMTGEDETAGIFRRLPDGAEEPVTSILVSNVTAEDWWIVP